MKVSKYTIGISVLGLYVYLFMNFSRLLRLIHVGLLSMRGDEFATCPVVVSRAARNPRNHDHREHRDCGRVAWSLAILYDHYLPTVILIIGIPSPTHSFTLGLNPSFSANPPYRTLSFFSFRFHYMDFPDCLLLLLSTSVYLLFSFPVFYTFLVVGSVR